MLREHTQSPDELLQYRCPHCDALMDVETQVADETVSCVQCHLPFRAEIPSVAPIADRDHSPAVAGPVVREPADEESTLLVVHPSMLRNHPILFLGAASVLVLGLAGLGIYWAERLGVELSGWRVDEWAALDSSVIHWVSAALVIVSALYLLTWWIQTWFTSITLTSERSIYQRGLIARSTSEVRHDDVRNLKVDQTFIQRLLHVGSIAISSSGQDDFEIEAKGMPRPNAIAEVIRNYQ